MTHGDSDLIKCPKCKGRITNPIRGKEPRIGEISEFVTPCPNCATVLRVWARCSIAVDAELDSKTK